MKTGPCTFHEDLLCHVKMFFTCHFFFLFFFLRTSVRLVGRYGIPTFFNTPIYTLHVLRYTLPKWIGLPIYLIDRYWFTKKNGGFLKSYFISIPIKIRFQNFFSIPTLLLSRKYCLSLKSHRVPIIYTVGTYILYVQGTVQIWKW